MELVAGYAASPAIIALVFLLLFVVGVVKGTLGFGSGLLAVPLLIQFFPPELAIAALTLPLWLGNIPVLIADGIPWETLRTERWLVILAGVGTVAGLFSLTTVPAEVVSPMVGGYLVVFLVARRRGAIFREWLPNRGLSPLAGGIGGFIHGAVLSGGPVFISYFHATQTNKKHFATMLTALFFLSMTIRLAGMYQLEQLRFSTLKLGLGFLLPLWLGVFCGTRVRPHIPQRYFEFIVSVLLLFIASKLIFDGVQLL